MDGSPYVWMDRTWRSRCYLPISNTSDLICSVPPPLPPPFFLLPGGHLYVYVYIRASEGDMNGANLFLGGLGGFSLRATRPITSPGLKSGSGLRFCGVDNSYLEDLKKKKTL